MVNADNLSASGYSFDKENNSWISEAGSLDISNQDKIDFVVDKIHVSEVTMSLEGAHPSLSLQLAT
jgi:hypothetical protein